MAIDLFCYTSHVQSELEELIKKLSIENGDIFSRRFIISKVREANTVHQEIASEHGLIARSMFLIGVNEKSAADEVPKVADIVKNTLGKDAVVILWENERVV